jgi:hypothetical protein
VDKSFCENTEIEKKSKLIFKKRIAELYLIFKNKESFWSSNGFNAF